MTHPKIDCFKGSSLHGEPAIYWADGTGDTLREVFTPAGSYFVPDYVVLDAVALHNKTLVVTAIRNPFVVSFWGSHPDDNNDDCFSGSDFSNLTEAREEYDAPCFDRAVMYVELDGPGVHEIRQNFHYESSARVRGEDAADRSERAMQAGMGFGVQGYNDEMGY